MSTNWKLIENDQQDEIKFEYKETDHIVWYATIYLRLDVHKPNSCYTPCRNKTILVNADQPKNESPIFTISPFYSVASACVDI